MTQLWSWRSLASYMLMAGALLVMLPFAIPLTLSVYGVVWLYTWTHDPRARTNLLRVLPLHPRRVYRCSRALWAGMLDGLGGPTIAIIFSYLAAKLSRSSRPQDTAVRDIKYGPQAKHRLDLFVPISTQRQHQHQHQHQQGGEEAPTDSEKLPILVIFPGYRWSKTKRARLYRPMAQTLCGDGMFVVLPRVGDVGASLEDILCDFHLTVQWVFENALNFGGDPNRVHLMGYGAGAHLCTMYSLVVPLKTWYAQADRISPDAQLLASRSSDQCLRRWLGRIKRIPRPVAGLILVSGVFDIVNQRRYETERCIENLSATSKTFKGQRELEEAWSPTTIVRHLRKRSAYIPAELFARNVLLIHGRKDSTFVLHQSQRFFRELCGIDVPDVNMKIYANLRRVDPSIALLAPSSALAQSLLEDIRASVSPPHSEPNDEEDGRSSGSGAALAPDEGNVDVDVDAPADDGCGVSASTESTDTDVGDRQQQPANSSLHLLRRNAHKDGDRPKAHVSASLGKRLRDEETDYFSQPRATPLMLGNRAAPGHGLAVSGTV